MAEALVVSVAVEGKLDTDELKGLIQQLPSGIRFSTHVTGPTSGQQSFSLRVEQATVAEAASVLGLFEEQ